MKTPKPNLGQRYVRAGHDTGSPTWEIVDVNADRVRLHGPGPLQDYVDTPLDAFAERWKYLAPVHVLASLLVQRPCSQALDVITSMIDKYPALRAPYEKARRTMSIKESVLIALQGCQDSTINEALLVFAHLGPEPAP